MDDQELLVNLRQILHEPPSIWAWWRLCLGFERAASANAALDVALDYAQQHLTTWPDTMRQALPSWKRQLLIDPASNPHPAWSIVRRLDIADISPTPTTLQALCRSPHLAHITHCGLSYNRLHDNALALLTDAPLLHNLHTLDLSSNVLGPASAAHLSAWEGLATLRTLRLGSNPLEDDGFHALVQSPYLPNLEHLDVRSAELSANSLEALVQGEISQLKGLVWSGNSLSFSGLRALLRSDFDLKHLDLTNIRLSDALVEVLVCAHKLLKLNHLNIRACRLTLDSIDMFAASPYIRNLTHLDVSRNGLGHEGARALSRAALEHLTDLNLNATDLSGSGLEQLASAPWLPGLNSLKLRANTLTAESLSALLTEPMPHLHHLGLGQNPLGNAGGTILAQATLPALEHLELADCRLGPEGMRDLCQSNNLAQVRHLDLTNNPINSEGIALLADSPHLSNLEVLGLTSCHLGDRGAQALGRARRWTQLAQLRLETNDIGIYGLHAILQSPWFNHLVILLLGNNSLGRPGVLTLARSQRLGNLMEMTLLDRAWNVDPAIREAIAASPDLARVTFNDVRPWLPVADP